MAYRLTHPNSKQEIEVDASMVATYKTQGWETAPTAKDPEPPTEPVVTDATPEKPAKK